MDLIRALQGFASPELDSVVLFLTNLGSEYAYISFLVVAYLAINARIGQRLGVALLVSFYLNQHAKAFFDTPRPFQLEASLLRGEAAGETALGAAFPSGHAQSSLTFWGLAAYYAKRTWFWVVALGLIALISLSRLYLGVHFPIDIVGGLVLGVMIILVALWAFSLADAISYVPSWVVPVLGIGIPLLFHYFEPTPDSALLLGGLAAFITGPGFYPHYVPRALWKRILLALIGLVLTLGVLFGSSAILPEDFKRHWLGGFVRYLGLGYVATLFIPWLARVTRLSPRHEQLRHTAGHSSQRYIPIPQEED